MNDATLALHAAGIKIPLAGHVLDLGSDELRDARGHVVELRPQVFQVLRFLALNAGRVVSKDELHAAVWSGLVVTDDSLVQAVSDLRRALGEAGPRAIRTVPRRGYCLVADAVAPSAEPAAPRPQPQRRWWLALAGLLLTLAVGGAWMRLAAPADPWIPATAQPMPDRPSIAVLAFRDPGGDAVAQQLARGVAGDLIAQLARNADLRVVASASSFALAGQNLQPAEVGRRLRSRYLVDGTVQRQGERLRLAIEMIDCEDGHVVWSAQHAVDSEGVLAARDALVQRIAGTLHTRLRQTEERRVIARPPKTLDVYTMTLRAIALKHQFHPEATREARRLLEQAIAIDPQYAPAWLYLGMLNGIDALQQLTGEWHPGRYAEMLAQSRRAIELDSQLPAAYFGLALVHVVGSQFDVALAAMQRCVELGPNDADCLMYLAVVQSRMGMGVQAQLSIERALDLNPLPPAYVDAAYAQVLWANRRLDEALRVANECIDKVPHYLVCRRVRLQSLVELARTAEAREEAGAILRQFPAAKAEWFGSVYADRASDLRERAVNAAIAAGLGSDVPMARR